MVPTDPNPSVPATTGQLAPPEANGTGSTKAEPVAPHVLVPVPGYPRNGYGLTLSQPLPPALSTTPDVLGLLKALRRRWLLAACAGVLAALAAMGITWLVMPAGKYSASTLLRVASNQPTFLFKVDPNSPDAMSYRSTQLVLIKSRLVLNTVLRQPKVAELQEIKDEIDPAEWLEKQIQLAYLSNSEVLRISVSGDDQKSITTLVTAITDAYLSEIVNKEHNERAKRLDQMKDTYARLDESLRSKKNALKALADQIGSNNPENLTMKQRIAIESIQSMQRELSAASAQIRQTTLKLRRQTSPDRQNDLIVVPEQEIIAEMNKDKFIARKEEEITGLEEIIATNEQRSKLGKNDPTIKQYRQKIHEIQDQIDEKKKTLRARIEKELQERARRLAQQQSIQAAEDLKNLQEMEKFLQQAIADSTKETRAINRGSLELESLKDEIANADAIVKRINGEIAAMDVESKAPQRVTLLDTAVVTSNRDIWKQLRTAGLAGFAAFGLALLGIAWREFRTRRLDTEDDVVQGLGLKLIGALPALPNRVRSRVAGTALPGDQHWQQMLMESVDATRTMLLYLARTEGLRTVLITSAVSGEGKTSLSSHLATSLARAGRRTLFIDCDLRRPTAHKLFEVASTPGLSELLRGEAQLDEIIRETTASGLFLLPAGKCNSATIEALAQDMMPKVLAQVKEQYDFIIIDTSPVLAVTDTLLISQSVDGVLLSLLRDVSRMPAVYAAYQKLAGVGVRILGAVVNGARGQGYGYYYRYQYGYGTPPTQSN